MRESVEEGVATPMLDANEERLTAEAKKIQSNMLHREANMAGGRRSSHRISRLRLLGALTAGRHHLLDVVDHAGPKI